MLNLKELERRVMDSTSLPSNCMLKERQRPIASAAFSQSIGLRLAFSGCFFSPPDCCQKRENHVEHPTSLPYLDLQLPWSTFAAFLLTARRIEGSVSATQEACVMECWTGRDASAFPPALYIYVYTHTHLLYAYTYINVFIFTSLRTP